MRVHVPRTVTETLGPIGREITLYTTMVNRDDTLALFGFPTPEGNRLFGLLLEVNGVGPRHALNLLSVMDPNEAALAIASGNTVALSNVHGIGKRTAGRILIDLQNKLEHEWEWTATTIGEPNAYSDLAAALSGLGYSSNEIRNALSGLQEIAGLPLEEQVRHALQKLARE